MNLLNFHWSLTFNIEQDYDPLYFKFKVFSLYLIYFKNLKWNFDLGFNDFKMEYLYFKFLKNYHSNSIKIHSIKAFLKVSKTMIDTIGTFLRGNLFAWLKYIINKHIFIFMCHSLTMSLPNGKYIFNWLQNATFPRSIQVINDILQEPTISKIMLWSLVYDENIIVYIFTLFN